MRVSVAERRPPELAGRVLTPAGYDDAHAAAATLGELTGADRHDAVVVLGSGWGPAAEAFGEPAVRFAMTRLPGFRAPVAAGHRGEVRSVVLGGHRVLVLLGRTHLYEGHGPASVAHPIRTAAAAGARVAVLTNANGSLRDDVELGQPILIRDHLNLAQLSGVGSPLEGPRFVDLTDAWSRRLRAVAEQHDPTLREGVYALLGGPHYETWAEAGWLRRIGADLVGMSTVYEAIAAREWGVELVGLSTVTAIEGTETGIDPEEVVRIAEATAAKVGPLLVRLVEQALDGGSEER
jgi:purine-nucleoside phosphorylase